MCPHDRDGRDKLWFKSILEATNFQTETLPDTKHVSIAIELSHQDIAIRQQYFEQLKLLKIILEESTGEEWLWQLHHSNEEGQTMCRVVKIENGVNIFNEAGWPVIISFLNVGLWHWMSFGIW